MTTIAQYDLLDMIREKCDIIGDDKIDTITNTIRPLNFITKLNAFILFRAMWYCDEVHDFCGKRSGFNKTEIENFSQIRFQQMITDNNRYFNVVSRIEGLYNSPDNTEFKLNLASQGVLQIMNHHGYNNAQKYVLRLYLGLNKDNQPILPADKQMECYFLSALNDLYNNNYQIEDIEKNYDIIPDLRKKGEDSMNLNKAKTTYITSDTIAHHITKTIRELFFKIQNISFNDLLGCKYEYDFYKASLLSNNLLHLVSKDRPFLNKSADLYLNIDPTGTGATLSPLYYTLWKQSSDQDEDCYKQFEQKVSANKGINEIQSKLIFSEVNSNVKLFITYANRWDASNDDELTSIAKTKIKPVNIVSTPPNDVNNIRFQIIFGTPDMFLDYEFVDDGGKTALQIHNFCGTPLVVARIEEGKGSVSNLANKIRTTSDYGYTVYKTCGDFLQFFALKIYEQSAIYQAKLKLERINQLLGTLHTMDYAEQQAAEDEINKLTQHKDSLYTMLSQDLTGMDIGSLFVFNMVGCMHSGDKLKGLNLFLSHNIINRIIDEKANNKEFLNFVLEVASPSFQETIQQNLINKYSNQFGKYKHKKSKGKKQKSKGKKQKPKSKNVSKKLEKLKKEALKMGLSKSSLKQGMAKLQKSVTKLKSLAKKYRLKINKKLITNVKKCIKIHDKAKKLKIKLTKTTKSGKRLYKTPSELLREIKSKMKQNKKTKYSRKNKHSKKR